MHAYLIYPLQDNEYIYAIKSVGSVLAPYDTNQRYSCFGFGAKVPPYDMISHCFALNGNEHNPEVAGINVSLGEGYIDQHMLYFTHYTYTHIRTVHEQCMHMHTYSLKLV